VNWRGEPETDSALRCGRAEGPLMVITTAGFDAPPDSARGRRFAKGVSAVFDLYGELSGNMGRQAFNGASIDGRGGFTLSFWKDGSVMNSVYLARSMRFQILKRRSARRRLWRTGCGLQTIP
jgi:hypothetical protein